MPLIETGPRVVVSVVATGGGDWQVVSTPTGFQGITSALFADNDYIHAAIRFENGVDWEEYDTDDDSTTNLLQIANVTGTVTITRPAVPYASSNGGARVTNTTGTHTLFIGLGSGTMARILREINGSWKTFTSGDATPDVSGYRLFRTAGTTTITSFDSMEAGKLFVVQRGASDITIADGASISLPGDRNITLTANQPTALFAEDGGVAVLVAIFPSLLLLQNGVAATELTIASGVIAPTQASHTVDTESDAASDDVDTITAGNFKAGDILTLAAINGSRTIVLKHGTGNIVHPDGEDVTLDDVTKTASLRYDGSNFNVISSGLSSTRLASTANGDGASLIGVEDVGGYFSGTDVEAALQDLGANKTFREIATLAALKALAAGSAGDQIYMRGRTSEGDGGKGLFYWLAGNQSSLVTADPGNGVYVPPNSDNTGASGVWARIYSGAVQAEWFGVIGDNSTDNTTAFGNALTYVGASKRPKLQFGVGDFIIDQTVLTTSSTNRGVIIEGQSLSDTVGYRTRFYWKDSSSGSAMFRIRSFQNLLFRNIFFDTGTQTSKSQMILFEANESPALSSLYITFEDCAFYERSAMTVACINAKSVGFLRFIHCFDNSNKFIKLGADSDVDPNTSNATLANGICFKTSFINHSFSGDIIREKAHGVLYQDCYWGKTQDAAQLPQIYASGNEVTMDETFINPDLDSAGATTNVAWFVSGDDTSGHNNGPYLFLGGRLTSISDGITIERGNARIATRFVANNSGTRQGVVIGASAGSVDWIDSDFSDWEGVAGRTNVVDSRTTGTHDSRTGRFLVCDAKATTSSLPTAGTWASFVAASAIAPGGKLRISYKANIQAHASSSGDTFSTRIQINGTTIEGLSTRLSSTVASQYVQLTGEFVINLAATTSAVSFDLQCSQASGGANLGTVLGEDNAFGDTVLIVEKVE